MMIPSAMPTTTVSAIPTENGHKVCFSAFFSAPLWISCSAASKIALAAP